jgi:beta-phosphoglucomutase-like phosphatase (HAD superfamily)
VSSGLPAAVLWDMDGTLVDTEPYWFESERDLVESFGGEWPDHHAKAVVGFDLLRSAAYIKEHTGIPLDEHEVVERMLDGVVARLEQHIPWRPGACRLLAELNDAGVPCALVTMSWHRFVDPVVAALPPGSFTAIVAGDDVPEGEGKPGPLPYLLGAEACGVHPGDCVAIEDSPTGVRSALRAGCHVLGVPNVRDIEPEPGVTLVRSLRDVDLDRLAALVALVHPPADARPQRRPRRDRRRAVIGGLVAVTAAVAGAAALTGGGDADEGPPPLPPGAVAVDAWAPYWALDDSVPTLESRLGSVREISTFFHGARGVTEIVVDENAPADEVDEFVEIARDSRARFVPSIIDQMPAGGMAAILLDPVTRAQHVETIRAFADDIDADGIDIDYEQFAFADGAATWETTRPAWVAFIRELSVALGDDGRTLTVSIPAVYDVTTTGDRGYWVYDHGAIAEHVDALRIMAYDYSTAEPGPIAPLAWVQQAIDGVSLAVPEQYHDKLVLGVPAYGSNWVVNSIGTCPASAEGRTTVTTRTAVELATRRGATPVYDPVTGEWSFTYSLQVTEGAVTCTQSRVAHWVDSEGIAARVELARRAGWGGVSLWALGYDDDQAWQTLVNAASRPL